MSTKSSKGKSKGKTSSHNMPRKQAGEV